MNSSNVMLRQEVYKSDALKIVNWLNDGEVTKYLNEREGVARSIQQVVDTINIPILTHIFNQNGSFFIIMEKNEPIGFLRLVPKGKTAEMVLAIGDKQKWGRGLGPNAIFEGLKKAFFDLRVDEVVAKVKFKNHRSKKAFKKAGFEEDKELMKEMQYSISLKSFLKLAA